MRSGIGKTYRRPVVRIGRVTILEKYDFRRATLVVAPTRTDIPIGPPRSKATTTNTDPSALRAVGAPLMIPPRILPRASLKTCTPVNSTVRKWQRRQKLTGAASVMGR